MAPGLGGFKVRSVLIAVAAVVALFVVGAVASGGAFASGGDVGFELDGNTVHNSGTTPPYDWADLFDASGGQLLAPDFNPLAASTFITDPVNANSDDLFTGGSSKDTLGIQSGPWLFTNTKPQGKDDLEHAFAGMLIVPGGLPAAGDRMLVAGTDRYDNSGDSTLGIWLLQDPTFGKSTSGPCGSGSGCRFNGSHEDGDLFLVADFTTGGSTSTVTVYRWRGTDTTGSLVQLTSIPESCGPAASGLFCNVVNSGPISTPWTFVNKSGQSAPAAGEFDEMGVDLTALPNVGNVPCFSTMLAETRSSQSTTATLSDFAIAKNFGTCDTPTITTDANPGGSSVLPGAEQHDDASVSAPDTTTPVSGTLTFFLCGPGVASSAGCPSGSGTQVGSPVTIANEGTASSETVSGDATATPGRYCWRAEYMPDSAAEGAHLPTSETNGTSECFTVLARPTVDTVAGGSVVLGSGGKLTDTAVLSGGSNPTGTITFTLYNPGSLPVYTDVVAVNGNGSYDTSSGTNPGGYLPTDTGTYLWTATYSGDALNNSALDNGQNENETVNPASPAVNTVAGGTVMLGSGAKLSDTAVVSGGFNPNGTITFTLYNPSNVALYTDVVTVSGNGSYDTSSGTNPGGYLPTTPGTYLWTATYSGDSNNNGASDNAQNENEAVARATPGLATVAALDTGGKLTDTAVLSGGFGATGTITFTLYNPSNVAVYTDVVTVNGDGSYSTASGTNPGGYPPTGAGTYQWHATYSGDSANNGATDNGQNETVTISRSSPSLITTAGGTVALGSGAKLTDTAVLSGGYFPTGTVTFTLYDPSHVIVVYTDVVTVSGAGTYDTSTGTNPGGHLPTTAGTYVWSATYSGDANNNGASDNGQNESQTVTGAPTATTITQDSPDPSNQGAAVAVHYTVTSGSGTPAGNVTVSDGVDNCTGTVAAGQCSITLTTVGARTLIATYAGSGSFAGSTSAGEPHRVNAPPTASITNGSCSSTNLASGSINLTLNDPDGDPLTLTLASNSNTGLVPNGNVVIGGSGTSRTVTVTGAANKSGSATLTFNLSDGIATVPVVVTVIVGTAKNETLNGTGGADMIFGMNGANTINGNAGNDLLCGGNGTDTLNGGDGNDILDGENSDDTLNGGNGNDILRGSSGNDTLTGGAGADAFSGGPGIDVATDFNAAQGDTKDNTIP
jgi:hypothetical protein